MSGPGSDGQQQMQMGTSSQIQHAQMQPPMQPQMRPQSIIRHPLPLHMPSGSNIVRMQRPQIIRSGQMTADQTIASFIGNQARMAGSGHTPQQVHVISQGMLQPQPQTTYMTADGSHSIQVGMIDQQRPVASSYSQHGNSHMQTMPMFQGTGQMRRRPGVQQSVYGTTLRVGTPNVQQPISTSSNHNRFISNNTSNGGIPAMHLVTQPSQVQVSQSQHFISTEAQQRMVVPQPRPSGSAMKVISSSQQHALASQSSGNGGQAIVRPSMSNIAQPPSQQPNDHSGIVGGQTSRASNTATPPVGPSTPEQQQQQIQRYLMIVDNAIQQLRVHHSDADLKCYLNLRSFIEKNKMTSICKVETLLRQIQQDPLHLLRKRAAQQQPPQHQDGVVISGVGGAGTVSEETRQKLLAQKGGPQNQRSIPPGLRPVIAASSSLNSLLSQPVDPPGATVVSYPGQLASQSATAVTARHIQQQQQQQLMMASEQTHQLSVDPFLVALDKASKDFIALGKKVGKERLLRALNEIAVESQDLFASIGRFVPRCFTTVSGVKQAIKVELPSKHEQVEPLTGCKRGPEEDLLRADDINVELRIDTKRSKAKEADLSSLSESPISDNDKDRLVCNGKLVTDASLTLADLNCRLRQELKTIETALEEVQISLVHPHQKSLTLTPTPEDYPTMEEMESHVTCRDVTEWNSSLHLKVLFINDKLMPCRLPPLFVRVPPDYLVQCRVNWHVRRSKSTRQLEWEGEGYPFYTPDEVTAFRNTTSTLVIQYLDGLHLRLRQHLIDRVSLYAVIEVWIKSILMGLTRFVTPADLPSL